MEEMQFIMISYEELVSLLLMCGYSNGIAGMQVPEFDYSDEEKKKYIAANQQKLIDSKFLIIDGNGKIDLDQDIAHLLYVLMNHQAAYIMIRSFPEKDMQEQVTYEICGKDILEHFAHKNGMHRFAIFPTPDDLYDRIRQLVPIIDVRPEDPEVYIITEDSLHEIITQVKQGIIDGPLEKLKYICMSDELAKNCISGIKDPNVSVSIMGIAYEDQLAIKVTSVAVFTNAESLWGIWPVEDEKLKQSEEKEVALFECIQSDVISVFRKWVDFLYNNEE